MGFYVTSEGEKESTNNPGNYNHLEILSNRLSITSLTQLLSQSLTRWANRSARLLAAIREH